MFELLLEFKLQKALIAIYTSRIDYDRFLVGYVLAVSEEYALFMQINSRGEFDGYSIRRVDNIYRVEVESEYLDKIKYLWNLKDTNETIMIDNDNPLVNLIQYAIDHHTVMAICIDEDTDDIIGYPYKIKNEMVFISQITINGNDDGKTIIFLQDILRISTQDTECVDLEVLYSYKHKQNKTLQETMRL